MEKKEIIEEEIMNLQKSIWRRNSLPEEVVKIIDKIKQRLKESNKEKNINTSNISEYIDSQFEMLKSYLNRVGENRKSKKMAEIINEVRMIYNKSNNQFSRNIIKNGEQEDKKESKQTTYKLLMKINELVESIYSRQKSMLNAQGFEQNDIERKMYDTKRMMQKYIENVIKENIESAFMLDNQELRTLEKETISNIMKIQRINSEGKDKFQEELKMHAPTLEEQREDADNRNVEQNNNVRNPEKSLPSDVLK